MAQQIEEKVPYQTVGGGGSSIDWEDPVNGPLMWEKMGWRQGYDGLWYHSNYGTLGFQQPPAPSTRGSGGPGGGGGGPTSGGGTLSNVPTTAASTGRAMTGFEEAYLITSILSGLGSMFGGGGDRGPRASFEDEGPLDPRDMLANQMSGSTKLLEALKNRASQPVTLRGTYAQQPPGMGQVAGMNVGLSGHDPALDDPSMLSLPGLDLGKDPLLPIPSSAYDDYLGQRRETQRTRRRPVSGSSLIPPDYTGRGGR